MTENSNYNYFKSDEFNDNLSLYEQSLKAGESCILGSDEISDIAEYYYEQGRYTESRRAAEYAVSVYPDASSPLLFLSRLHLVIGNDIPKAKEFLNRVVDRTEPEFYILSGEIMLAEDNAEGAIRIFEEGESNIDEEELPNYCLDVAHSLLDYEKYAPAKTWAEKSDDKDSPEYIKLHARLLLHTEQKDYAIKLLEGLIDRDPFDVELWNILSSSQNAIDKYSDALTSSEYAIAIDADNAEAYMNKGNAYFKLGNYEKAITAYKRFSSLNNNELGNILTARCLFCLQRTDEALRILKQTEQRCCENQTNLIDTYKDLAIIYGWLGKDTEANRYISILRGKGVDDPEMHIIEGGIMLSKNRFEDANFTFMEGYEKSNNSQEYLFQTAVSYYEHGYDAAAYMLLKEIFTTNPERTHGMAYLAICCYFLGKKKEYLEYLKIVSENNPDEAKSVLSDIFPKDMEPCDYYQYALVQDNRPDEIQPFS